jgi:hypothetical protein
MQERRRAALRCRVVVEKMSEYLDGGIDAPTREGIERHLSACSACGTYLQQLRLTIEAGKRAFADDDIARADVRVELDGCANEACHERIPLGLGGESISAGEHLAYFWESASDFDHAIDFLAVGLRGDDHCLVLGHEAANRKVLDLLHARDLDVNGLLRRTRLSVLGGQPTGAALLEATGAGVRAVMNGGNRRLRLLGNLGWGRPGWPSDGEILAFEARVTGFAENLPCAVLCMYDVNSLPGRTLLKGGLETHPTTVRRGVLRANPHYVPEAEFSEG